MYPLIEHFIRIALNLLVAAGPLPWALWLMRHIVNPNDGAILRFLISATFWFAAQTLLGVWLGATGFLFDMVLYVLEAGLLISGLLVYQYKKPPSRIRPGFLEQVAKLDTEEKINLTLYFAVFAGFFWISLSQPFVEFDTLFYHLPTMIDWVQTGSLTMQMQPGFEHILRYPFGWEIMGTLFLIPMRSDLLAAAPNLLAWPILGAAIYQCAREAGAGRAAAIAATVLLQMMPLPLRHIHSLHVDMPFFAFIMVSFALAAVFARSPSVPRLLPLAASLGLMAGIKATAAVYGLMVAVFAVALICLNRRNYATTSRRNFAFAVRCVLSTVLFIAAIGGFWYSRNWIETGNPLGDLRVEILGRIVFHGNLDREYLRQITIAHIFRPGDPEDWRILIYQVRQQLHIVFPALVLAAMLSPGLLFRRNTAEKLYAAWCFALLTPLFLLFYCFTPFTGDNGQNHGRISPWVGQAFRHGFPFFGMLAVSAALGATWLESKSRSIARCWRLLTLVCFVFASREAWRLAGTSACVLILVAAAVFLLLGLIWDKKMAARISMQQITFLRVALLIGCLTIAISLVSYEAMVSRLAKRNTSSDGLSEAVQQIIPPGSIVGSYLCYRAAILSGIRFDRYEVPVVTRVQSLEEWEGMLQSLGVEWIAVGPILSGWMVFEEVQRTVGWLESRDGPFCKRHGSSYLEETVIYSYQP